MTNKYILVLIFTALFANIDLASAQNNTNSSEQVKNMIYKKRAFNKDFGFGYTIQLYYGNETEAKKSLELFKIDFPLVKSALKYDQPYWKVHVGNYKTKLEADKKILLFKEKYSGVIVIPMGK